MAQPSSHDLDLQDFTGMGNHETADPFGHVDAASL
jgi:hypothetical protein